MSIHLIKSTGARTIAGLALLGAMASVSHAQTANAEAQNLEQHLVVKGLEFNFMPGVWMPRLSGNSTLGPSSTATELDNRNDLQLNNSEPAFNLDFSVRKHEDWQIKAGGFGYSNDSSGTFNGSANFGGLTLNTGDAFSASFDMSSFNLEVGYWFTAVEGPGYTHLMFAPVLGFRYINIDFDLTQAGVGKADTGGDWACPYVGAELELRWDSRDMLKIIDQVQIAGGVAAGPALGGDGGWMGQVHAELTLMFTRNFGVFFGYKLVDLNAENEDFEFNGGLEGLYFGGVLRF